MHFGPELDSFEHYPGMPIIFPLLCGQHRSVGNSLADVDRHLQAISRHLEGMLLSLLGVIVGVIGVAEG